jgi:hypothetical protein
VSLPNGLQSLTVGDSSQESVALGVGMGFDIVACNRNVKQSLDRVTLPSSLQRLVLEGGLAELPVTSMSVLYSLSKVPLHYLLQEAGVKLRLFSSGRFQARFDDDNLYLYIYEHVTYHIN